MDPVAIGIIGASIGVPLVYALFRKFLPYKKPEGAKSIADLEKEQKRWDQIELILLFVFAPLLTYFWYRLFVILENLYVKRLQQGVISAIVPEAAYWLIPAIFFGIASSTIPLYIIFKLLFSKKQLKERKIYEGLKFGFEPNKASIIIFLTVLIPSLVMLVSGFNYYVLFTEKQIIINRLWTFQEERYYYREVKDIKSVLGYRLRNGKYKKYPYLAVNFNDGSKWTTQAEALDPNAQRDQAIAELLKHKTGKTIQTVKLEP